MTPELLAPAGNIEIAISAFNAGADAVYLGLKQFSARSSSINFDWSDLRKLKLLAKQMKKKIYITLNTIIEQSEINEIFSYIQRLSLIEVDAIIIQDLGLGYLINQHFPNLEIHTSTQMAINSAEGLEFANKFGLKRVILPRESSLTHIKEMQSQYPHMDLEVFIHGALCYSYSGLCLASGLLFGTSGNRGKCSQVCRTYFGTDNGNKYPFSCNDLFLSDSVNTLKELQVSSFKIEGRLKSVDYVTAVVKLYRYILDSKTINPRQLATFERDVACTFSREQTTGYLFNSSGKNLINPHYSKNIGFYLTDIKQTDQHTINVDKSLNLKPGDELLILKPEFSTQGKKGYVKEVRGRNVSIHSSDPLAINERVHLFKRSQKRAAKHSSYLTLWKQPISLTITLQNDQLNWKAQLTEQLIEANFNIDLQPSDNGTLLKDTISKMISKTDQSWFIGVLEHFDEQLSHTFIAPSIIKKMKRKFWQKLDLCFEQQTMQPAPAIKSFMSVNPALFCFANRQAIALKNKRFNHIIPFAHLNDLNDLTNFHTINNKVYIPLHPILSDGKYWKALNKLLTKNADTNFVLGLNNPSHIHWLKQQDFSNVSYWIDYYLYMANTYSLIAVKDGLPNYQMEFAYGWIEQELSDQATPFVTIKDALKLPLMISKGCIKKGSFGGECNTCNQTFSYALQNVKKSYRAIGIDCLTYVFIERK